MMCEILHSSFHRLFSEKLLLQIESWTLQSVKVYSQSSVIAILARHLSWLLYNV